MGLELDLLWWVGLGPVRPEADPEELELLLVLEVSPLGAGPDELRRVETGEPGSRSLKSGLLFVLSEKLREFRKRLVRVSICDIFSFGAGGNIGGGLIWCLFVVVVALSFWVLGWVVLSLSLSCFFLSAMCVAGERRAGASNGVEKGG